VKISTLYQTKNVKFHCLVAIFCDNFVWQFCLLWNFLSKKPPIIKIDLHLVKIHKKFRGIFTIFLKALIRLITWPQKHDFYFGKNLFQKDDLSTFKKATSPQDRLKFNFFFNLKVPYKKIPRKLYRVSRSRVHLFLEVIEGL